MKIKIASQIGSMGLWGMLLWLCIHNLHKDPANKITLFSICFFSATIGMCFMNIMHRYTQIQEQKEAEREQTRRNYMSGN
ncbi:MAG: hypothetical protein H0X33_00765 [Taibaiella sp.]|nr:hypothetical protein [Taibaiella sp.]